MSRAGNLYWQAASKAAAPFRRIYFDTEPLAQSNWPFVSAGLGFVMRLASTMKAELCVPEAALHERCEQCLRQTLEALAAASTKINASQKFLKPLGLSATLQVPTEKEIRDKYADAERQALSTFAIQRIPFSTHPLESIFRMAVAREFTFEENKAGVVGLQDCTILLSAFEHLAATPVTAAFISKDHVFSGIPSLASPGVDMRFVRGVDELDQILQKSLDATYTEDFARMWSEMSERITAVLMASRSEVQRLIEKSVYSAEIEKLFPGAIENLEPPSVLQFGSIRPDVEGAESEPIKFSCDVNVLYTAVVQKTSNALALILSDVPSLLTPTHSKLSRDGVVELGAQVDPDYSNLRLISARIRE